ETVLIAKISVHMSRQPKLADKNVPDLCVMKATQSLLCQGYMKGLSAWRHFYWYLPKEGTQYLRDYIHQSPEITHLMSCTLASETADLGAKDQRVSNQQDLQEGRWTETPTKEVPD
ncbi:40S ribosomal protein S10, partial [Sigmodon hispidus]